MTSAAPLAVKAGQPPRPRLWSPRSWRQEARRLQTLIRWRTWIRWSPWSPRQWPAGAASISWSTTRASFAISHSPRWTWRTSGLWWVSISWDPFIAPRPCGTSYSAAKMAVVGLMQTLAIHGRKIGIHVNCLAPTAATRMVGGPGAGRGDRQAQARRRQPRPARTRGRKRADAPDPMRRRGSFETAQVTLTRGIHVGDVPDAAEQVEAR